LKPALLPRCSLPLHRPIPHPQPCTPRDPLLPQYPVLSNYFLHFPLHHRQTVRVAFRLFQAVTGAKENPEGVRREPTLKAWQTFRLSLRISFRPDALSCFLVDEAAAVYSSLSGTVNSKFGRQQRGQKLCPVSKAQVLARIRSSSFVQRCNFAQCGSSSQRRKLGPADCPALWHADLT
jgi:hypothetical protein